jgi:hypothetical protein
MRDEMGRRELLEELDNSGNAAQKSCHIVQTYQDENFLVEAVSVFVAAGLRRKEGIILVLTKNHWDSITHRLTQEARSPEKAVERKQLVVLDAESLLSKFMQEGLPDEKKFKQILGDVLDRMQQQFPVVRVYGEMVDILWRQGNRRAGIKLEALWNDLGDHYPFSLFCAYAMNPLDKQVYDGSLQEVCAHHSHFIPTRDYSRLEKTIDRASDKVLGRLLSTLVRILTPLDAPSSTQMPEAQAALFWLAENMPTTAQKVLAQIQNLPG